MNCKKVDRAEVRELLATGLTAVEVARRLGTTPRTILRAKADLGLPRKSYARSGGLSDEDHARIRECLDAGWSFNELGRTYGYTHATLSRYYPGRGMDPQEAASLGLLMRDANRAVREALSRARQTERISA
ncbi:helix-turn-helix DNA binding domain protein [Arthrobacter phage Lilmac1015]|uniref:Helix-turn-helix DNA binding domain protein n=1 Tax=Arthrobacter phage Lilmac1015 TaxID=2912653 RepID=A0AA49BQ97_9CAUD|nr:helix-turn-helix DNA binding domain protein [Arthrobacter phage Lilmac1015]